MSVREKLNDKKVGTGVAIALFILAISIMAFYFLAHWHHTVDVTKGYFSDDDGNSYYKDSVYNNFPPFDHNGKTAVQAVAAAIRGFPVDKWDDWTLNRPMGRRLTDTSNSHDMN
jgi:hypothetical protein